MAANTPAFSPARPRACFSSSESSFQNRSYWVIQIRDQEPVAGAACSWVFGSIGPTRHVPRWAPRLPWRSHPGPGCDGRGFPEPRKLQQGTWGGRGRAHTRNRCAHLTRLILAVVSCGCCPRLSYSGPHMLRQVTPVLCTLEASGCAQPAGAAPTWPHWAPLPTPFLGPLLAPRRLSRGPARPQSHPEGMGPSPP